MEQFGAARNTVRKAIARLAEDGLIHRTIGSGTYVAANAPATATIASSQSVSPLDVLEARMAVEPGFSDLLVARATEEDFARMEDLLDRLERAKDQQSFREAGYAFHLEIARATRNPLLVRIFGSSSTRGAGAGIASPVERQQGGTRRPDRVEPARAGGLEGSRHRPRVSSCADTCGR